MKNLTLALAVLALTPLFATAQRGGGGMMARFAGGMLTRVVDADKSGDVSTAEWTAFKKSVTKKDALDVDALKAKLMAPILDGNADGKLTTADLDKMFKDLDRNDDKIVSAEEMRGTGGGANRGRGGRRGQRGGEGREGEGDQRRRRRQRDGGEGNGEGEGQERRRRRQREGGEENGADGEQGERRRRRREGQGDGEERRPGQGEGRERRRGGQDRQRRGQRGNRWGRPLGRMLVGAADADKNKSVTEAEWKAFVKTMKPTEKGVVDAKNVTAKLAAITKAQEKARKSTEEGEGESDRRRSRRGRFNIVSMMDRMFDIDQDGKTTMADLDEVFGELDQDGNGALDKEEMRPRRRGGRGQRNRDV